METKMSNSTVGSQIHAIIKTLQAMTNMLVMSYTVWNKSEVILHDTGSEYIIKIFLYETPDVQYDVDLNDIVCQYELDLTKYLGGFFNFAVHSMPSKENK